MPKKNMMPWEKAERQRKREWLKLYGSWASRRVVKCYRYHDGGASQCSRIIQFVHKKRRIENRELPELLLEEGWTEWIVDAQDPQAREATRAVYLCPICTNVGGKRLEVKD